MLKYEIRACEGEDGARCVVVTVKLPTVGIAPPPTLRYASGLRFPTNRFGRNGGSSLSVEAHRCAVPVVTNTVRV